MPVRQTESTRALCLKNPVGAKLTVLIDGHTRNEVRSIRAELKEVKRSGALPIDHIEKVRAFKDEAEPLIRLADSMAGFLRDFVEGHAYAQQEYRQLQLKALLLRA